MKMSDYWFSYKLAPDGGTEDGCHPDEAQALKDYLVHEANAAEAAHAITHAIAVAANPGEDLVRLWALLMDALMELPKQHIIPLVELLKAIENLPEPVFTAKESNWPHEKLWKGLPGFGHLWSDMHRSKEWRSIIGAPDAHCSIFRDLRDGKLRQAEVEARLVDAGLAKIPVDWGYETVADALESSNVIPEIEVLEAAEWLVLCCERFRQGARNGEKSWGLRQQPPPKSIDTPLRDLWKERGDEVMSPERWDFWRERLRALQAEAGVVKNVRKVLDAVWEE